MENERFDLPQSDDTDWFDGLLKDPNPETEIGPDEIAVYSAGLTDPADIELEKILAEHRQQQAEEMGYTQPVDIYTQEDLFQTRAVDICQDEDLTQTRAVDIYAQEAAPAYDSDATCVIPDATEADATQTIPNMDETRQIVIEEEAPPLSEKKKGKKLLPRKSRPGIKKGYGLLGIPHIISTAIWAVIILAIGVSLGRILWVCCADVMAFGRPAVQASVTIEKDDDIDAVAQKLAQEGLIAYPELFKMFAEITGKDERISAGTFNLGSHLDYNAMINAMGSYGSARVEVEVLFPEGVNCAQVFRILEKNGVCTIEEMEEYAANGELKDYWFLEGVQRGDKYCLEGYLAPDTYKFYTNDNPKRVLEKFLDEFDNRFTDIMKEDLVEMQERYSKMLSKKGYSSQYIQEHPLTLHQVLTVASIVDRETASDSESYDLASIFYNRLTNPDYPTLGSDATVYYAIGDYFREKDALTEADLNFDSPYNTRVSEGLPPGPICNPSVYSLYAALDPNDTNYYFFIYDRENYYHLFSKTYKEHVKKAEELGY